MGIWAVHLSDGLLTPAWWLGGFAVAGLLVLLGAWRLRDEDVPRVALLTAAFFVVSLIHVPVPGGPKAHLLLAGLLGVVLGRHAALAVPIGLVLQTILFSHGGLTMLGVNAVVMTVPALLAWLLFAGLRRLPGTRTATGRATLLFVGVVAFLLSAVFAVGLLATNPWTETDHLATAGALAMTFSPWVLLAVAAIGLLVVLIERRNPAGPEFALGLLVGEVAVLVAVALNGLALLLGGVGDWHAMVFLTVLIHLPLAVVEGVILGFTIRFLARVQPDLIGLPTPSPEEPAPSPTPSVPVREGAALLLFLLLPAAAWAHGIDAQALVDTKRKQVAVECWFETGDAPKKATIVVKHADGKEMLSDRLDAEGKYHFHYDKAENLTIEIDAGQGHRVRLSLTEKQLASNDAPQPTVTSRESPWLVNLREIVTGLAFILALAAFVLALRNGRKIADLERALRDREPAAGPRV